MALRPETREGRLFSAACPRSLARSNSEVLADHRLVRRLDKRSQSLAALAPRRNARYRTRQRRLAAQSDRPSAPTWGAAIAPRDFALAVRKWEPSYHLLPTCRSS